MYICKYKHLKSNLIGGEFIFKVFLINKKNNSILNKTIEINKYLNQLKNNNRISKGSLSSKIQFKKNYKKCKNVFIVSFGSGFPHGYIKELLGINYIFSENYKESYYLKKMNAYLDNFT